MAEPVFKPKPGQVDYTSIRYCPVFNCIVTFKDKILLVHRSADLRLYPDMWNGVSGFLDDNKSVEEKVKEELLEELFIHDEQVISIKRGPVLLQEAPDYGKTWLVVPVLAELSTDIFELDWEAQDAAWLSPAEAKTRALLPGFKEVLATFF